MEWRFAIMLGGALELEERVAHDGEGREVPVDRGRQGPFLTLT